MAALEMSHHMVDLECGLRRSAAADAGGTTSEVEEEEEEGEENECSACFSDEGSCDSHEFYSTADGDVPNNYDDYSLASEISVDEEGLDSGRVSSSVDLEIGGEKNVDYLKKLSNVERDCRICHLSLVSSSPGCGVAIELGCSCKDDLAAAHKHCAETWFKIKGNKTCEICNSIARNIVGPNDIEASQHEVHDINAVSDNNTIASSAAPTVSGTENRSCLNGHRFLNFLLACMVFAFVISWLFHFSIPS